MSKLVKAATEWLLSVEKICTRRGPAGGDGGRGGDVVLVVEEGLRTLMDFRFNRHFKATPGENGMSKGMHGRGSEDLLVKVPPGTTVRDAETGALIGDLIENGQTLVVAKGGRGGRGNIRFASPRNPAPEIAENGEPGQERKIELELKSLSRCWFSWVSFCREINVTLYYLVRSSENWCLSFYDVSSKLRDGDY